ncbi:beta-lactamase domain protein [hydrothermal vent metagenome]|uniref:Beta-lactamase domain protein n=1 Tax=hydrothermal vent metagenome TaxID=652676 RepID=A0A1W1BAB5_9ZZZZ
MRKTVLSLIVAGALATSLNAFDLGKYGEMKFEKANQNVYIMHGPPMNPSVENQGFMNNPAIIEGKNSLIMIDPGGNYNVGKKILAEVGKISKKPIVAIIDTHKHGDHWFAGKAIAEKYPNVKIYALQHMIDVSKAGEAQKWYDILERLSKNLKGTKEFKFPEIAIKNGDVLKIDDQTFYIHSPKRAHTDTDVLIVHANSKTLFLGDNLMKSRLGGFDSSSSILGNIKLLEEIEKAPELTLYVPGHGHSGKMHETIDPFLNYMKKLVAGAKEALENDMEAYEIKPKVAESMKDYHKWDEFDGQMGKHLQKALVELEALEE